MSRLIIVPEPHISSVNIDGRSDYIAEIKSYMNEFMDVVNINVDIKWVVFVGDIFNRGFNDIDEYFWWLDWFLNLDSVMHERGGVVYSAIGNHELTFSKSNPFWRFTSSSDSGYNTLMDWKNRAAHPIGLRSLIHVEDVVELGDSLSLFFCHYEAIDLCSRLVDEHILKYGDTKKRVCVCHNSIISNTIANVLRSNYGRDPLTHFIKHEHIESLNLFHKFDYVFNGHMHKAFSKFTITDDATGHQTYLMYLGSLGRTNSEEINDSDLSRLLPYIDVDTYSFGAFEIELWNRGRALKSGYDNEKMEVKTDELQYKEVCKAVIDLDDPVRELKNSLSDFEMQVAFECAVDDSYPPQILVFKDRIREVMYNAK